MALTVVVNASPAMGPRVLAEPLILLWCGMFVPLENRNPVQEHLTKVCELHLLPDAILALLGSGDIRFCMWATVLHYPMLRVDKQGPDRHFGIT